MTELKGRRIALVGGAGFIGHNLALALSRLGAEVSIVDSLEVNNFLAFASNDFNHVNQEVYMEILQERLGLVRKNRIPLYIQDARDYGALNYLLDRIKPETVVHLAAVAHANISNKDPYSTFDHSLRTLENALDAARGNVNHFVYFSSSMVYGNFESGTVTEESPCNPLGIYGTLKWAGEKIVQAYHQVFGLEYTIIRPSALYGERCVSRRVGQIFVENAIRGKDIVVQGDGSDKLDFTYIDDLVQGVSCVLKSPKARNQIFNMTYGEARSIGDLATIVGRYFPDIRIQYEPKDKLTPDRGTLAIDKARKLIGYNPEYPLEKGFERYVGWYEEIRKSGYFS